MWEVPRDLLLGRYPRFVRGGPLPRGHVPVFCFHSPEPDSFGRKVEHLVRNGYATLSADEYLAVLSGQRPAPERAVVLTFDDARSSVRTVAWPLMRRHGLKGIVFAVPARVSSRPGPLPPTWDDVLPGRVTAETVLAREHGPDALLSWEELAQLAQTGLFDIQSHTLSHAQIHIAPRVAGFLSPADRVGYAPLEVPLVRVGEADLFAPDAPLGTPLLRSRSRLSDHPRFYESAAWRAASIEMAAKAGPELFRQPDWAGKLRASLGRARIEGRYESAEEREAALRQELEGARKVMQERLGRPVDHVCYPWHVAGELARRLTRQAGYRAAHCGKVPGVPITLPGNDPMSIARVGEDYLELLPGQGRRSLAGVLSLKWRRRLRGTFPAGRYS